MWVKVRATWVDAIQLGYQAALVSLHSPTYGRLWLSNRLHPGDTVSVTQAQSLVEAAEMRTGVHPRRRPELVVRRIAQAEAACNALADKAAQSAERLFVAQSKVAATTQMLNECQRQVFAFEAEYRREQRQPTRYCKLTRAQRSLATYQQRLPRNQMR